MVWEKIGYKFNELRPRVKLNVSRKILAWESYVRNNIEFIIP